jgi:peptidoglycan/xylan/chitin deacetylase (PgdA/CDA1 family)
MMANGSGADVLQRAPGAHDALPRPSRRSLPQRLLRRAVRFAGRHFAGTITHVETTEPVAALTFDDGPDPATTPRLLEILDRHGAKATFFMLGEHALRYPELVQRIAAAGHAIANHSFDHRRLPSLSRAERRRQVLACEAALSPYGQKLFRPPRGLQSLASWLDVTSLGYQVVTWNVVAWDWEVRAAEWTAEQLSAQVRPGSIVLLHDVLHDADITAATDRTAVFTGLDSFLARTGSQTRFITVPQLLLHGQPHRANWFVRTDNDWGEHNP